MTMIDNSKGYFHTELYSYVARMFEKKCKTAYAIYLDSLPYDAQDWIINTSNNMPGIPYAEYLALKNPKSIVKMKFTRDHLLTLWNNYLRNIEINPRVRY